MKTLGITTPEQLRQVDHRAVIAWERMMREEQGAASSTVRRRQCHVNRRWPGAGRRVKLVA